MHHKASETYRSDKDHFVQARSGWWDNYLCLLCTELWMLALHRFCPWFWSGPFPSESQLKAVALAVGNLGFCCVLSGLIRSSFGLSLAGKLRFMLPFPSGDWTGTHCQPLLHHQREHADLQSAAETHLEWNRTLPGFFIILRVQEHYREGGTTPRASWLGCSSFPLGLLRLLLLLPV